jgi:hypothetical protein
MRLFWLFGGYWLLIKPDSETAVLTTGGVVVWLPPEVI